MAGSDFRLAQVPDWTSQSAHVERGVTVIVRTKDRPVFLRRALASVAAQDYSDLTVCLINDGGDRHAVETIARSCLPKALDLEIVHHDQSLGQPASLNAGFARVNREFFAVHDDDDSWSPLFLSRMVAFLRAPSNRRFIGAICYADEVTEIIERDNIRRVSQQRHFVHPPVLRLIELLRPGIHPPPISQLMRHSALTVGGLMNLELPVMYDFEWTIRVMREADIVTLPETLAYYHLRGSDSDLVPGARNSSVEFQDECHRLSILLQNQLMRNELSHGRIDLGFASSLVHLHDVLYSQIEYLRGNSLPESVIRYLTQRARRHDRARIFRRQLEQPLRYLRRRWLGSQ